MAKIEPPNQIRISYKPKGKPVANSIVDNLFPRVVNAELERDYYRKKYEPLNLRMKQIAVQVKALLESIENEKIPGWVLNQILHIQKLTKGEK